jgi:hypothetical protein
MNKLFPISCLLISLISISGWANSEESDIGFWKSEECKKVSEASGFFLHTSGELLKSADIERKAGNEKKSEKTFAAALFFSELSENAAKNFEAFCKK